MAERVIGMRETTVALTEEQQAKFNAILASGPAPYEAGQSRGLLTQREGFERLHGFLYQGLQVDLLPFQLRTPSRRNNTETEEGDTAKIRYSYSFGEKGSLDFSVPKDVDENNTGNLWAIPRVLKRGEKPYYWLDLYNPDGPTNPQGLKPFKSGRLAPENKDNKIEFLCWRGVEEIMLADFVMGENGLDFEDLLSVDIHVGKMMDIAHYRMRSQNGKFIALGLLQNNFIRAGDDIRLLPRRDDKKRHTWVDIINITSEDPFTATTYQILPDKHIFSSKRWLGYEREIFSEYANGEEGVVFNDLKPMYFRNLSKNQALKICMIGGVLATLTLDKYNCKPGANVVVIPKQDEHHLYQWLETYVVDPRTLQPVGENIGEGRVVVGEGVIQKGWQGPERQALRDFTEGKINFDQLYSIPSLARFPQSWQVYLWTEEEGLMVLPILHSWNVQEREYLTLKPREGIHGESEFVLTKGESALGAYNFDYSNRHFTLKTNIASDTEVIYNNTKGFFVDSDGNRWAYKDLLVNSYGLSERIITRLCSKLMQIREHTLKQLGGGSTRRFSLYSVEELEALPEFTETIERIYAERRQRGEFGEAIPAETADQWLKETMEE